MAPKIETCAVKFFNAENGVSFGDWLKKEAYNAARQELRDIIDYIREYLVPEITKYCRNVNAKTYRSYFFECEEVERMLATVNADNDDLRERKQLIKSALFFFDGVCNHARAIAESKDNPAAREANKASKQAILANDILANDRLRRAY